MARHPGVEPGAHGLEGQGGVGSPTPPPANTTPTTPAFSYLHKAQAANEDIDVAIGYGGYIGQHFTASASTTQASSAPRYPFALPTAIRPPTAVSASSPARTTKTQ
jgi:hypothetical protein